MCPPPILMKLLIVVVEICSRGYKKCDTCFFYRPKNGLRGLKLPPKFALKIFFNISKNNLFF